MSGVQWVGAAVIAAGILWAFVHPKETGDGEVGFRGFSAKGLTQGGVIVAVGAVLLLAPLFARDGDGPGSTATAAADAGCHVSGKVYEEDSQRPFAGVDVGLVPPGSGFADEEQFHDAATTGPQGSFSFDCDDLLSGHETAMIALSYAGWGGCIDVTERRVRGGDLAENVTLYVSEKVQEFFGRAFGLPKNDNCEPPGRSGG